MTKREQAARDRAADRLGEVSAVETDRGTGGVRFLAKVNGTLTGPRAGSPEQIVLDYVRGNEALFGLDADDVAGLVQNEDATTPDGIAHVGFVQVTGGIPSFHSGIRGHVDPKGRIVAITGGAQPDLELSTTTPGLGADAALAKARADAGGSRLGAASQQAAGPERRTEFATGERASLVAFPTGKGARLAWQVEVDGVDPFTYTTVVDAATGDVLFRDGRTEFASGGEVFQRYPGATPAGGGNAVNVEIDPPGQNWLSDTAGSTRLAGQNTHAYADRDNNNAASVGENIAQSGGGNWLFPQTLFPGASPCPPAGCTWDSANVATEATNRSQSVTNLFYHVNKFHDYMRDSAIGFDAASGNFENVDRVLAEGNDGGGTNNANFNTPADGASGRMQMYLWTTRDVTGNDDAGIIYHEYAHGLSNRLVGGPLNASALTTNQARGMGEGWSDWYGLDYLSAQGFLVDTATIGDVVTGDYPIGPGGIRSQGTDCRVTDVAAPACPSVNGSGPGGFTYGDLPGRAVPHGVGEVWGQTLWDLRREIAARDGNPAQSAAEHAQVLRVVTGGMRLAPSNPTFLEMRDAILVQIATTDLDLYQTAWEVFRARGMGFSATSPANGDHTGVVEAFDAPTGLAGRDLTVSDSFAAGGDGDGVLEPGEGFGLTQQVQNLGLTPVSDVSGTLSSANPGVTIQQATAGWPAIASGAIADNSTLFRATAPGGACTTTDLGLTLDVTSSAGNVSLPLGVSSRGTPDPDVSGPARNHAPALAIPDNNPAGVSSDLVVAAGGTISDLNVRIEKLTHTWIGDLKIVLTHVDTGTAVTIIDRPGVPASTFGTSVNDLLDTVLDDEAESPVENVSTAGFTGRWTPNQSLSAFDGESIAGTWRLTVSDNATGDTGGLHDWNLNTTPPDCTVSRPVATTSAPTVVSPTAATLAGQVGRGPGSVPTEYRFAYGSTPSLGAATAPAAVPTDGAGPAAETIPGLAPQTTYYYRVETLRGGSVAVAGDTIPFTTPAVPVPPAPPVAPAPTGGASLLPPTVKDPAKLRVLRAGARDGRLDVLAEITKRASGELKVKFLSGGRTHRFTEDIPSSGVVKIDEKLPSKMRRARSGILEIEYEGDSDVRSDDVRLRAANGKALLKRTETSLKNGLLKVGGTISSRARGVVRIRYDYVEADGSVKSMDLRAKISKGKWSMSEKLTGAAAQGGQLSIQFTGYLPARMRGEQTAKAVP